MKKKSIIIASLTIVTVFVGVIYWQSNGKLFNKKEEVEQGVAKPAPAKEETDDEILTHYKTGRYTAIARKINPYDKEQELSIITFHDYEKFNEPPPVDCGTRATTCYILLKKGGDAEVIARVYSASSPFRSAIEGDFVDRIINDTPLIRFIDKDNVILRSVGGFAGEVSFIKINLRTKEVEIKK